MSALDASTENIDPGDRDARNVPTDTLFVVDRIFEPLRRLVDEIRADMDAVTP